MASINSSYGNTGIVTGANNGIGGLMSGLATDDLVKNMTLSIRSKIAKQQQNIQLYTWKMTAYQSITSKLQSFANKFLTYSSSTNALTGSFYQSTLITPKGEHSGAVSVTGTSSATSSLSIQGISSLASKASFLTRADAGVETISSKDLGLSQEVITVNNFEGKEIVVNYEGTDYTLTIGTLNGTTNADVAAAINDALANIEIDPVAGTTLADKISVSDGADDKLTFAVTDGTAKIVSGTGGSLGMIGITAGAEITDTEPLEGKVNSKTISTSTSFNKDIAGEKLVFQLNGIQKEITIKAMEYDDVTGDAKMSEYIDSMQAEFDKAFGQGKVTFNIDGDKFVFKASEESSILTLVSSEADIGIANGTTNRLNMQKTIVDAGLTGTVALSTDGENAGKIAIKVNGEVMRFAPDMTIKQIMDSINSSDAGINIQYLSTTNRFVVTATETGAHGDVSIEDAEGCNFASLLFGTEGTGEGQYTVTKGSDAVMKVSYDGGKTSSTITRSTNSFELDGLTIVAHETFAEVPAGAVGITFDAKVDTDKIYDNIKSIIDDYNSMIELIGKELTTKYDRNYPPLSDEQRAEMSESEINSWEEKAKVGLLYNDNTLRGLANELRTLTIGFSKYNVGISPSTSWQDNGKIIIDEDKLRKAIEGDPELLQKLFTAPKGTENMEEGGMLTGLKTAIDKYATTVGETKGILVTMAGAEGSYLTTSSTLYSKISDLQKLLATLEDKRQAQADRYYKQFTSLETYMSKITAQTSWLSQQ